MVNEFGVLPKGFFSNLNNCLNYLNWLELQLIDKFSIINFAQSLNNNGKKIAVIGDAIIDEFYYGKISRISPEAPIPIFTTESFSPNVVNLGGCFNLFQQIKNLKQKAVVFSIIDNRCTDFNNLDLSNCTIISNGLNIPIKKRWIAKDVIVQRIDVEKVNCGLSTFELKEHQNTIISLFSKIKFDIVLISDYNKGLFTNINLNDLHICKDAIIIVDSKVAPLERWCGCSIIKLNEEEAFNLTFGVEDWKKQCDFIAKKTNCKAVIITCASNGFKMKENNNYFEYFPKINMRAISVIGAGDVFTAILGVAISCDIPLFAAAKIACFCASLYVSKNYMNFLSLGDITGHIKDVLISNDFRERIYD